MTGAPPPPFESLATHHGRLAVYRFGDGAPRYLSLHGFTLGGRSFAGLAGLLPGGTLAPDLPGHGRTQIHPVDLATSLATLDQLIERFPEPPVVVGYSQGGRIGAQLAARRPERLSGLVMISATAGVDDDARAARLGRDEATAAAIEAGGLEAFIDRWLSDPLVSTDHLGTATRTADRIVRLENTADGLAAALRGLGQGALLRVEPPSLHVPTLWISGERDTVYTDRMAADAAAADGRFVAVPGAGHNVMLDDPHAVAAAIEAWLR